MPNQFKTLFANSFDTFKVFDNLTPIDISAMPANAPKTIWQILNHLIKWQDYQIAKIRDIQSATTLNEDETWIHNELPAEPDELNLAVNTFKNQQQQLESELAMLDDNDPFMSQKLKIVQDLSVHLSFHLGEIILMRRMAGTYPLPHQMKDFLI